MSINTGTATVAEAEAYLKDLAQQLTLQNTDATIAEYERVLRTSHLEPAVKQLDGLIEQVMEIVFVEHKLGNSIKGYRERFLPLLREFALSSDFYDGPKPHEVFELRKATVAKILAGQDKNGRFGGMAGWIFEVDRSRRDASLADAGIYFIIGTRLDDKKRFRGAYESDGAQDFITFYSKS